jgi:peptide/nickel transport system substrate-binding protein
VIVLLALVLGACGGDGGNGGDAATPTTARAGAALPDQQQVLTVATPGDFYVTRDGIHLGIWPDTANICETLVGLSPEFQAVPALATRWTLVPPNTWRFELRRDVRFHNGEPFTAQAVEYSFKRTVEKRQALTTQLGPDSVRVVDDHTVEVTPTAPNLRLPEQITHPFFSIVAPGTEPAQRPVCTGPFEFVSYTANDRLTAQRFDGYWGEKARLRQLVLRFVPDQNTRRLALESGDVDAVYFLPPQVAREVGQRPGLQVVPPPPGAVATISMNLRGADPHTLLSDIDLRRAFAQSLDPQALAQFWQGGAEPVTVVSPPAVLGGTASTVRAITNNLQAAEALLEQKGWRKGADGIRERDGRRLTLVAVIQADYEPESLQLLQSQARRAGFDLRLEQAPDAAAYAARINAGTFDVDINYFNQNDANPARIVTQFWSEKAANARIRYTGPGGTFETLIDEAQSAPDTATAARKAAEAHKVLIEEQAAAIPLTSYPQLFGVKTTVAGFAAHPSVNHQPWTAVYRTE